MTRRSAGIRASATMLGRGLAAAMMLLFVASSAMAAIPHYEVRVDGLACPFCAYGLEKKLADLPGVSNVAIDLDSGLATFDVDERHTLPPAPVREAVREAGFTPRDITIRASGTVEGSGDELSLDVGHDHALELRGGEALARLRELVQAGHRELVITGPVTRSDDRWRLQADEVARPCGS